MSTCILYVKRWTSNERTADWAVGQLSSSSDSASSTELAMFHQVQLRLQYLRTDKPKTGSRESLWVVSSL